MDQLTQIITNVGVSGVFLLIAYVVTTQSLPRVFDAVMGEMRTKREEFLSALKEERTARMAEREEFLSALAAERLASQQAFLRLEQKFENSLALVSTRMGELTAAVNAAVERTRIREGEKR